MVSTSGKLTAGTHALTPSGGMDQLGYDLAYKSGTVTVDPASITAVTGIRANNKVYDATASAMLDTTGAAFSGAVAGDLLSVATASGAFTDKHAGTGKTVNIAGLTIGGADADNYILMSNTATTMANITRRAITVTARSDSKVYDQTTASAVTPLITSGTLQGADTTGFVQTYDTKNVGTGKTLTASGLVNDGNGGANYVVNFVTDRTGVIIAKPISANGIVASSKIYDQTTTANVDFASAVVLGGATSAGDGLYYSGDAVALNTASARGVFADKNVGIAKPVNVSGLAVTGADAGNYILGTTVLTADITPKPITATGITASNRTYDATTLAAIDTSAAAIKSGATGSTDNLYYAGDAVALDTSAAIGFFAGKNVGINKPVMATGLALTGADAGNYVVSDLSGATASIAPATVAGVSGIAANSKIFDGTTRATLDSAAAGFTGMFAGDALAVATATGNFVEPSIGTAKTVDIGGITLGGSDAGNYLLASTTARATADIVPAATEGLDAGTLATTSTPSAAPVAPSLNVEQTAATALRVSNSPAINTAAVPKFTLPTWQVLSDLWELRRGKLLAIESAVRILERNPNAADLPDCGTEVEVASNCIVERRSSPRRAAAEQPSPKLAHVPQITRKVALLIGVADYQGTIPKLGSPLKDVQEIGKLYAERFGYDVRLLPDADKATIVGELNRLILESGPNDSVTVFYAGHGHVVEKTGRGYWIPAKASSDEPSQWISNQDIGKFLARIPAKQILLVSDSCYSGTLARDAKVQRAELAPDASAILARRSVTVLSSGGDEPVADSGKDGHSVFAWHFIRTAGNVEGVSRGVDIYEQVAERVMQDFPQEPQYGAAVASGHETGADFLFEVRRY
ncbi:MAG TPA: YDG domain-containing protein [Burkholderiales bacterium]|nr:YDG domain-containing protein [Burkholderiales bacterium]